MLGGALETRLYYQGGGTGKQSADLLCQSHIVSLHCNQLQVFNV